MRKSSTSKIATKQDARRRRSGKTRANIRTQNERPRVCAFRSSQHMHAMLTDPHGLTVMLSVSTNDKDVRADATGTKSEQAKIVGKKLAAKMLEKGIKQIAFDRSGYKYHGRIKALAEGLREGGMEF